MATKLRKMKLTSVDLVRAGANQEADICLFKSAEPPEATEQPSEAETNIFKRFLNWLRENPTEAENEPHSHIEKAEDQPDLEYLYKSALAESLQSIMADDTLTEIEKKSMTEESLRQYADKIRELEEAEEDYDGGNNIDEKAVEEVDDFDKDDELDDDDDDTIEEEIIEEVAERRGRPDLDEIEELEFRKKKHDVIEEVEKYNHNHGDDGKFSSGPGGGGGSSAGGSSSGGSGGGSATSSGSGSSSRSSGSGGGSQQPSKMKDKELGDAYFAAHDKMGDKSLSRSEKEAVTREFEMISAEMDRRCEARGTIPYIDHSKRTIDLT